MRNKLGKRRLRQGAMARSEEIGGAAFQLAERMGRRAARQRNVVQAPTHSWLLAISVVTQPPILFLRRKRRKGRVGLNGSGAKRGPKASLGVTGAAFRCMRILLP